MDIKHGRQEINAVQSSTARSCIDTIGLVSRVHGLSPLARPSLISIYIGRARAHARTHTKGGTNTGAADVI